MSERIIEFPHELEFAPKIPFAKLAGRKILIEQIFQCGCCSRWTAIFRKKEGGKAYSTHIGRTEAQLRDHTAVWVEVAR